MTILQTIIFLAVSLIFISLMILLGTYLQDNLVFADYKARFTPHGLIIKALDVLIIVFFIVFLSLLCFRFDYLFDPTMSAAIMPITGSWNAQFIMETTTSLEGIFGIGTTLLMFIWLILMFVFTNRNDLTDFLNSLMKGEN